MTAPLVCKIELPGEGADDDKFETTKSVSELYDFAEQIGEGTYGQVYVGCTKGNPQDRVALKKIRMDTEKEGFPITALREIKILSTLRHENVVTLRHIARSEVDQSSMYKGAIYMVFDYADHDLTGLMERCQHHFTMAQIKCLMMQLLKGLAYCHANGVLHRDLKASNLLIDHEGVLKIADFGLARPYLERADARLTNRVITLWYRPPELLLGAERYGPEIDMWSVGCILAELLTGKPVFPGKDEADQLHRIFSLLGMPTEATWPGVEMLDLYANLRRDRFKGTSGLDEWCRARDVTPAGAKLLRRMLMPDPKKRISAKEAIGDDFFWHEGPVPCTPSELPRVAPSHEWTIKKKRNDLRNAQPQPKRGRGDEAPGARGPPPPTRYPYFPPGPTAAAMSGRPEFTFSGGGGVYGPAPVGQQQHQQQQQPAAGGYPMDARGYMGGPPTGVQPQPDPQLYQRR